jgi:hypothetical protein
VSIIVIAVGLTAKMGQLRFYPLTANQLTSGNAGPDIIAPSSMSTLLEAAEVKGIVSLELCVSTVSEDSYCTPHGIKASSRLFYIKQFITTWDPDTPRTR